MSKCPNCGSSNLDGDNLAAWCNDCGWDNLGTYQKINQNSNIMGVLNKKTSVTEKLSMLEKLLIDNAWVLIVGDGIHDGLYSNGLKSITSHNKPDGYVMSVLFNGKVLKKFYDLEEAISDALLVYFITEYEHEV